MKGLLLKEFYIWLRTRSWIMLYIWAISLLTSSSGKVSLSVAGMGILIGSISSSFLYDEKSNWQKYCKALPCTPFERVTSKYIIHSAEFFIAVAAYAISYSIAQENYYSTLAGFIVSPPDSQSYIESALMITSFAVSFAIQLPICFRFKGTLRTVMSLIPLTAFLIIYISTAFTSLNGNLTVFFEQKYIPLLIIAASIVLLAASWMISVIIETGSDGVYKKKFKKIAIILIVIAVALASVTAFGFFKSEEKGTADPNGKYEAMDSIETTAEEIDKYYDLFCGELHIGTKIYDYVLALEDAGYIRDEKHTDIYYSESGNIMIDIGISYPSEDKIGKLNITCKNATKAFESATYASFKNIGLNFKKGMTESELHEKFNELEIIPCEIEENTFYDTDRTRQYSFEFITPVFEGEKGGVEYTLRIDTDGEKVTNVTDLMMNIRENTPVPTDPEETPLEIANREATAFLKEFCNGNRLESTPRECTKQLRKMGYTESEETDDLYHSENGKISVSLITNENDELEKITAIANYGEMKYIESATDKDMKELSDNITVGMTETQFIEKITELDMLPDIITEKYGEGSKVTRTYEIRYRIGDFNSDGAVTYTVTVDITDGKVTNIDVYYA